MSKFRYGTHHHLLPRSRGGRNDKNIDIVKSSFHSSYHLLFGNRTYLEAASLMDNCLSKETIDYDGHWERVFGDMSLSQASEYLRKRWKKIKEG